MQYAPYSISLITNMYSTINAVPATSCAFHQQNLISHFCRFPECLLPLCRDCLPIHRREHGNKCSPIELYGIEEETGRVRGRIGGQLARLDQVYQQIVQIFRVGQSNHLHSGLRHGVVAEREQVLQTVGLYFDSLLRELDRNHQRRQAWLIEMTEHYRQVREELLTILERLQGEKHLRTIIMWNRLKPEELVGEIGRQARRELDVPSLVPMDVQQLIKVMGQSQKMTVLDLQGDMGFGQLERALHTLRFGEEEEATSLARHVGISLTTKQSKISHKLSISKSTGKL